MPQEPEQQSPSSSPPTIEALDGSLGEEAQKAALWHLIEVQINLAFDAVSFVSDGTVRNYGGYLA